MEILFANSTSVQLGMPLSLDLVFAPLPQPPVKGLSMVGRIGKGGRGAGGTFLSLRVAYISNLSLLHNLEPYKK